MRSNHTAHGRVGGVVPESRQTSVAVGRDHMTVMRSSNPRSRVWPDALALPCPACDRAVRLRGVRSDLRLLFQCPVHGWFEADSWSSVPTDADPCVRVPWSAGIQTQKPDGTGLSVWRTSLQLECPREHLVANLIEVGKSRVDARQAIHVADRPAALSG